MRRLDVERFWLVLIVLAVVLIGLIVLRSVTKKRYWNYLIALVVLATLGYAGYRYWQNRPRPDPLAGGVVYTVQRGEVLEVVEATGNLSPVRQAALSFSIAGRLESIAVSTGERVRAGQVLAVLEKKDLELQLAQAQAGLEVAEANLQKLLAGAREEDIAAAQSALNQALAAQQESRVTLSAATEQARLSWVQAANALRDAQATYSQIYWDNRELEKRLAEYKQDLPEENRRAEERAWRAVQNAEAAMEQARLAYEAAKQREESSARTAQAQVASARANLERLLNGATSQELAAAQASVEQARAALNLAQAQLEKAALRAPFDGVVTTVLANPYDQVSSLTPILILADLSSYRVDVEVDEVDIGRIRVGQEARITLDALPGVELPGRVEEVALSPTTSQGVITYRVRLRLTDLGKAELRPGLTVNARIITGRASGVLIVPRRAVRLGQDGQPYVEKVLPGKDLERVPVQLGLEGTEVVEIASGLKEGETIFVRGVVQQGQLQQIIEDASSGRPVQMRP